MRLYHEMTPAERRQERHRRVEAQNNLCHHCKAPLDGEPAEEIVKAEITREFFPENFFRYPIHLHHCHRTGKIIGVVHARCNAWLWEYKGE